MAGKMALHERVKTALDETRTLILGAQILLGFQYQSVFREQFDTLPPYARIMDGCALGLMILTVGLLVAPSAFHRIVEHGESTGRAQTLTGRFAAAALLPFAVALGLDLTIALERALHSAWMGRVAGVSFSILALAAWYGSGEMMKQHNGAVERRKAELESKARETAPLHARIEQMLTEARVVLPGAQALLGFQLVIVLASAFEKLPETSRLLHGVALLSVALVIILLITPAALHRIVWAGEDSEAFLRLGGKLITAALVPLAAGMALDAYVVLTRVTGLPQLGMVSALVVALLLLGLWLICQVALSSRRSAAPTALGTKAS
jgi:hypothetical protein